MATSTSHTAAGLIQRVMAQSLRGGRGVSTFSSSLACASAVGRASLQPTPATVSSLTIALAPTITSAATIAGQQQRAWASNVAAAMSHDNMSGVGQQHQQHEQQAPSSFPSSTGPRPKTTTATATATASPSSQSLRGDDNGNSSTSGPTSPPPSPSSSSSSLPTRRTRAAPLQLTDRAIARIKELLASKGPSVVGVRLGTKKRGCNGLSYTMNYTETRPKFDEEVSVGGVTVFVEPSALMHVVGTRMDFEETELSREFTFHNPNAKGSCGCGESFNV